MINSFVRAAVAALVLVAASAGHAQTPSAKLMVDFAFQGQQSPFVLAVEGGHFSRAGVSVTVDRGYGSADVVTKVASGAYDFGFADIGSLITFTARQGAGKVISVFQVYDVAPIVIIARKKSGITKPADLAGKKIASPPGTGSRLMFPLFAAANKIDPASINWVDVNPQLRETLLAQGSVDAITALITDLAGLAHIGIPEQDLTVMRFGDFGLDLYGHCILTSPEFAAKNPETVKRVVKGAAEAWKAAIANPASSVAALKKREPLTDEALDRARLEAMIKNAVVTDRVKKDGLGDVVDARMKETITVIAKTFNLAAPELFAVYRSDFKPPKAELMLP
jgi:NitT/TauT family transport system substrate-binding protein